jgi:DNA processing protein
MEEVYFNVINKIFKPYQPKIIKLYHKFGNFETLYNYLKNENKFEEFNFEEEEKLLKQFGIEILTLSNIDYPEKLKNIDTPPLGIYLLGNKEIIKNSQLTLAIVGTRKASEYGLRIASRFSQQLSELGISIISGLAYGIDLAAHKATLKNPGKTIAILGEGIVFALQTTKRKIIEKIIENDGLIISEFSPTTPPLPYHFPLRNRIIAGLSDGVIIIEAPIQSGALITANYGLKYGKDIFVIPGEITNKNFEGSHNLIKQGAKLITNIEDILTEFNFDYQVNRKLKNLKLAPQEELIYDSLKIKEKTIEELNKETKIAIQELLVILSYMEIKGIIKNREGKFYLT